MTGAIILTRQHCERETRDGSISSSCKPASQLHRALVTTRWLAVVSAGRERDAQLDTVWQQHPMEASELTGNQAPVPLHRDVSVPAPQGRLGGDLLAIPKEFENSIGAAPVPPSPPSTEIKSGFIPDEIMASHKSINSCFLPTHNLNPIGFPSDFSLNS